MWYSFHIYLTNRDEFYKHMQSFMDKWHETEIFFIQYMDFTGFHFRVRMFLPDKKVKDEALSTLKCHFRNVRILEKIYDPEYNTYGSNLPAYENYSCQLSAFLIRNNVKKEEVAYSMVSAILRRFDHLNEEFVRFYITYWKKALRRQRFIENDFEHRKIDEENEELANALVQLVEKNIQIGCMEKQERKDMCFQYLHMSLNKLGCLINEEITILLQLSSTWRAYQWN